MDRGHNEKDNIHVLFEASLSGCVSTLNKLVQRDALILHKISLTSFSETPLHIAALLGHVEFTRALLSKKPKLAHEVDAYGRAPLHLASAEGHTEIVEALLQVNVDVCLVPDQDGRIPLHFAAMRGRIEIIRYLIAAQPDSIRVNLDGDTVLHMCVRYNRLDALKLLVQSSNVEEFLNSKDHHRNSILHVAVMLKQMKTIKYLLSVEKIETEADAKNKMGYTALDLLEACPRDFQCLQIQNILKEAGVRRSTDLSTPLLSTPRAEGLDEAQPEENSIEGLPAQSRLTITSSSSKCWQTYSRLLTWVKKLEIPGRLDRRDSWHTHAGGHRDRNDDFPSWDQPTSGFPLTSKLSIWFLTLAMSTAVTFMALTYMWAVGLATPDHLLHKVYGMGYALAGTWILLHIVHGLIHTVRLISWMMKKLRKSVCRSTVGPADDVINV
ncbi:hypothetical protein CJ030_MR6G010299 [Morella rubra]|uniref:Uncharacterized protein n=1 Tax=Morella rubra TaxID=262757 RepID=A0A6A1VDM3_9ROSI|nr:hypothetical protein CJ030_MR6G010299 [Morella rubra]